MNWIDAEETKPEPHKPVAVIYTEGKHKRWARAMWVPKFSERDYGNFEGDTEYNEAEDEFYCPEGWYEWNNGDETVWLITEDVTCWAEVKMPT